MLITFTDPGMHPKHIEVDVADGDEDGFFDAVLKHGGQMYADAHAEGRANRRLNAWKELGGEWRRGTFGQAIRARCRELGFDPGVFNTRWARDLVDYEGESLGDVAERLRTSA
jgi:hypothetical protein